jgi:glycosyltransferase involved in cell wall biosynthesis
MKIAILHEMLIKLWGAEKVAESLMHIFPRADLFTLMYDEKQVWKIFPAIKIHPSCKNLLSQKIYSLTKKQRLSLPIMPRSVESLDFSSYDVVIVSSSGFAHGLKTWRNTKTIIYYHAPARYLWDWTHEYRKEIRMNHGIQWFIFGRLLLRLRRWDYYAAQNNNILLANSATTQKRIWKYFRRESEILYPPIETARFEKKLSENQKNDILRDVLPEIFQKQWYYIILSALTEFKRLDIAIKNFKHIPDVNLIVIGRGDYKDSLEKIAWKSKNILFIGAQFWDILVALVQYSMGLVFPGEEDFWIVPIEVMAAWKPVFALKKWGLTETVIAGETWEFFTHGAWSDFIESFKLFHKNNLNGKYTSKNCIKQAQIYDEKIFQEQVKKYIYQ